MKTDFWIFCFFAFLVDRGSGGGQKGRGDQTKRRLRSWFSQSNKISDNSSQTFNGYIKMVVKGALLLCVIYQNYYFNSQTAAWFFDDS